MAAAMRAWGGRAAQAADEVGQMGSALAVRWRGRMTRRVLIAVALRPAHRHGHRRLPPPARLYLRAPAPCYGASGMPREPRSDGGGCSHGAGAVRACRRRPGRLAQPDGPDC
eukprot:14426053-Alexandrium_andersonii.AAC.1